ncbi:hypothetical protein ABCS02_03305 [Microbacterium sp. X-17]|uniref:hypothetical protein n=1 Tax=Microbacterium sp. X-17 TaxID=3144404 RepID=UPI0031F52D32
MSDAKRQTGLARPGMWLARVVVPPAHLDAWGMIWRLVVRWTATIIMTAVAAFAVWAAVKSPQNSEWLDLGIAISGWVYSVLLTVGVTVAISRMRRNRRSTKRMSVG